LSNAEHFPKLFHFATLMYCFSIRKGIDLQQIYEKEKVKNTVKNTIYAVKYRFTEM
jgi:hypothetical protein